jgi:hypothetical protein
MAGVAETRGCIGITGACGVVAGSVGIEGAAGAGAKGITAGIGSEGMETSWLTALGWPLSISPSPGLNMNGSNSISTSLNVPCVVSAASGLGSNMNGANSMSSPLKWAEDVSLFAA